MKVSVTGHRPDKLGREYNYKGPITNFLVRTLEHYIETHDITDWYQGMAIGFDQISALVAIRKKLRLHAAIPFEGQESMWPQSSQQLYHKILSKIEKEDIHILFGKGYTGWKMQKRNEWMVNQLTDPNDELIGCWNGTNGGTKNCLNYAVLKGLNPLIINPDTYKIKPYNLC